MGLFGSVEEDAAKQAIALAGTLALPVSARSLPAEHVRSKGCALRVIVVLLALVAVAVLGAVLVGAGSVEEPRRTIIIVAVLGFAAIVGSSLVKGWRSRRADYVDPMLVIEAGPEGVTISGPNGRHSLRYGEVRARIDAMSFKQSVRFVGVKMEGPAGTIVLNDALFENGRAVAAAIVRGMRQA